MTGQVEGGAREHPGRGGAPARRGARAHPERPVIAAIVLVVLLAVSIPTAIGIGAAPLNPADVARAVLSHLGIGRNPLGPLDDGIVWLLRTPRVLTAAVVGAGLALCGAVMQALTRNPLADPYLLGLSSGASLGAVIAILFGGALVAGGASAVAATGGAAGQTGVAGAVTWMLPVAAFAGALIALAATLGLAGALGPLTPTRTVLAGVAVSALFTALTSFVVFWNATGDAYQQIVGWLLGSLAGARWPQVAVAAGALLVIGGPIALSGRVLDAFAFGDTSAASMGVSVTRTRWLLLGGTALLTGALVAVSGAIGFVGLVLPHAVRLVIGPGNRALLPLSALVGAVFLLWADTLARSLFEPRELPVGIVTAIVGAPAFAALLARRRSVA